LDLELATEEEAELAAAAVDAAPSSAPSVLNPPTGAPPADEPSVSCSGPSARGGNRRGRGGGPGSRGGRGASVSLLSWARLLLLRWISNLAGKYLFSNIEVQNDLHTRKQYELIKLRERQFQYLSTHSEELLRRSILRIPTFTSSFNTYCLEETISLNKGEHACFL